MAEGNCTHWIVAVLESGAKEYYTDGGKEKGEPKITDNQSQQTENLKILGRNLRAILRSFKSESEDNIKWFDGIFLVMV